ncbi:MAG: phosphatidate cytidylyltransferase [Gemmatimonadetes bacterium]|nr:phosphatidate cytidylyltransferase [Gemmatimonadota bacterium]
MTDLGRRVAVAAGGVPVAVTLIWLGGWPLGIALALLAAAGAAEVCRLAAARGVRPYVPVAAALAAAFVTFGVEHPAPEAISLPAWTATLGAAIAVTIAGVWLRGPDNSPLFAAAATILGALITGGALVFAIFLRELAPGTGGASWLGASIVAYPIMLAWMGDTFAYFCGHAWGRRKLIPSVSPGKTVVGAVAGLVGTVITGALYGWLVFGVWHDLAIGPVAAAIGGVLIGPAAQLGDLAESLLKRDAGVKDSGTLFPGHGGVLDRFDAIFTALPVGYLYLAALPRWIEGLPWGSA